jgi:prophage regulatory protein
MHATPEAAPPAQKLETKTRPARPRVVVPETLHREQRIDWRLVSALTGSGRTKIFEGVAEGTFPEPERDGPRWSRWRAGDVLDWLEANRERHLKAAPASVPDTTLQVAAAALQSAGLTLEDLAHALQAAQQPSMPAKARGRPAKARSTPSPAADADPARKCSARPAAVSTSEATP